MGINLRLPNITGATTQEQMVQMRSYMHQLVEQLQWALNTIESPQATTVVSLAPSNSQGVATSAPQKDSQTAFSEIKALIIKSAEIVDAYYEQIESRLVGEYTALSEFGEFKQTTERTTKETSEGIETIYKNTQTITSNVDAIDGEVTNIVSALSRIKSGLLYYDDDGNAVHGIEIGDADENGVFTRYARIISNRLSFYDQNGNEVAYISDQKLYITKAEVTTLQLGGYSVDTSKGLTFRWVGRS